MMYQTRTELPLFKNIFPNYETFRSWYTSIPLSSDSEDVPSEKTFTLIAYEYNSSHCSMLEEDFKQHFAVELYTFYKEFESSCKSIDELMKLQDDDIAIEYSTIMNTGETPETPSSTDVESVDFVSVQQKTINKKGTLQIKKEILANKRVYATRTFLKRFKHLFRICVDSPYVKVIGEHEGD